MLNLAQWEEAADILVKIVRFPKRFVIISYPEGRNFQFGESRKGVMMGWLGTQCGPSGGSYLGKLLEWQAGMTFCSQSFYIKTILL